jgi:hypothetical protein
VVLVVSSGGLVAALHLISDLDPASHRLSEYATGPGGWLMVAAFLALGAGVATLGWAISTTGDDWRTKAVAIALSAAGAATVVAGLFRTDPGAAGAAEAIHARASGAATLAVVGAALLWSFGGGSERGRRLGLAAIAAAIFAVLSALLHETAMTGLSQRVLWFTLLVWLVAAALALETPGRPGEKRRDRRGAGAELP